MRADRKQAVAGLAGPGRIALAGLDDGAREVEGECRGLAAVLPTVRSETAGSVVAAVELV